MNITGNETLEPPRSPLHATKTIQPRDCSLLIQVHWNQPSIFWWNTKAQLVYVKDSRLDVGVAELSELWYTAFVVPAPAHRRSCSCSFGTHFKQSGLLNNVILDHYVGMPGLYYLREGPSHPALSISWVFWETPFGAWTSLKRLDGIHVGSISIFSSESREHID